MEVARTSRHRPPATLREMASSPASVNGVAQSPRTLSRDAGSASACAPGWLQHGWNGCCNLPWGGSVRMRRSALRVRNDGPLKVVFLLQIGDHDHVAAAG